MEVDEDWYMCLSFLSKQYVPIKMDFYGYWHRKVMKEKNVVYNDNKENAVISKKYIDKVKKEIKYDTSIIQFDKIYQIDFKDIPTKIEKRRLRKQLYVCQILKLIITLGTLIVYLNQPRASYHYRR